MGQAVQQGVPTQAAESTPVPQQPSLWTSLIAGGCAGATSRTLVSPLERLKIIMQVQPASADGKKTYPGVWKGLSRIWQEEGFYGFMRGNGLNCLRIAPYSAVQFATYESMKRALLRFSSFQQQHLGFSDKASLSHSTELHTFERLVAGAVAGFTSVVSTYPLDLVRARISIASASMYTTAGTSATVLPRVPGVWETTMKVYRDEGGFRGLYRGCIATSLGVAPYVAFNFVFYESARSFLTKSDGTPPGPFTKLCIGAFAGAVSQTLTYPVDVVRRRMQVSGMKNSSLGVQDKGGLDSLRNMIAANGIRGLYHGLFPNLLKVAPSTGAYFLTYELVVSLFSNMWS